MYMERVTVHERAELAGNLKAECLYIRVQLQRHELTPEQATDRLAVIRRRRELAVAELRMPQVQQEAMA